MATIIHKLGADLKVGNTIKVWWSPQRDTITRLRVYDGPLAHLFKSGAWLAEFALNQGGMTIDGGGVYQVFAAEII